MKTYLRYTLLCLFALSSALCGAKVTCWSQNLHKMYNASPKTLEVKGSVGTTDSVTYTCSGGAKFSYYGGTPGELAIYLDATSAQVVTTLIKNLTQIIVTYLLDSGTNPPKVAISTNGVDGWINLSPQPYTPTAKIYAMPSVGDYYVRIKRNGTTNTYIKVLEYCCLDLSGCPNCFLYKPE